MNTIRGAVFDLKGNAHIEDCTFTNNKGTFGAIVTTNNNFTLNGCVFRGNTGTAGSTISMTPPFNAGLENVTLPKQVYIKGCVFQENVVTGSKSSIVSIEKTFLSIHNITFVNNTSPRLLDIVESILNLTDINISARFSQFILFTRNNSRIKLQFSTFLKLSHTQILYLSDNSSALFDNCTFINNGLNYLTGNYLMEVETGSDLHLQSCHFENNYSLFLVKESALYIFSSTFFLINSQSIYCHNSNISARKSVFKETHYTSEWYLVMMLG